MKIIVSEIPEEGIELDLKDDIQSDVVRIVSPVKSVLRLDKIEDEVIIKGALSADVELECSRCLNHFPTRISSQVNVVYHPVREIVKSEQHELKSAELDTVFYTDDLIETDDLLRRAAYPEFADEASLFSGLQGLLPAMRRRPEYFRMRLRD